MPLFTPSIPPVSNGPDLRRILALPRRAPPTGVDLVGPVSARLALPPGPCRCRELGRACITELRPVQAAALVEIARHGGFLGPIGTGFGKTLVELLAPFMLARHGVRTTLLLVPAALVAQIERDVVLYGQHFRMPDVVIQGARTQDLRRPGAPLLHVMSYNRLSLATATDFLNRLRPDAIIADECQNLRAIPDGGTQGSVRAGRVFDYIRANPRTRFLAQSGSMTKASLDDYGHLADWALANPLDPSDFDTHGSPLPIDPNARKEWCGVIDAGGDTDAAGALRALCNTDEDVRSGFRRRLHETPGVIATTEAVIDACLEIRERHVTVPRAVRDLLEQVRGTWQRPDGEELVDALSVARCMRELACGLYLRWIFPRGEPVELILEWLEARKRWHSEMRDELRARTPHMDSPLLCARAAARAWSDADLPDRDESDPEDDGEAPIFPIRHVGHPDQDVLPKWKAASWPRWRDVRKLVRPETEAVRVDDYLARDAAAWGLERRGIIWYETVGFSAWVEELSGLPRHGAGGTLVDPETKQLVIDGSTSVILSARSYGTGTDGLQYLYADQLFAQPRPSGEDFEQALGRTFRLGQHSPVVRADVYRHTEDLADAVDEAVEQARYVQETMGQAQKLLIGWRE